MLSAAAVLVCALDLLARQAGGFAPIVLIDTRPDDVSPTAEAFVRRNPDTIYLITTTPAFLAAKAGDDTALKKIASIIVHEQWHIRNGPDERGAYQAQLAALFGLGIDPGSLLAFGVRKAMLKVLAAQKRAARPAAIVARN